MVIKILLSIQIAIVIGNCYSSCTTNGNSYRDLYKNHRMDPPTPTLINNNHNKHQFNSNNNFKEEYSQPQIDPLYFVQAPQNHNNYPDLSLAMMPLNHLGSELHESSLKPASDFTLNATTTTLTKQDDPFTTTIPITSQQQAIDDQLKKISKYQQQQSADVHSGPWSILYNANNEQSTAQKPMISMNPFDSRPLSQVAENRLDETNNDIPNGISQVSFDDERNSGSIEPRDSSLNNINNSNYLAGFSNRQRARQYTPSIGSSSDFKSALNLPTSLNEARVALEQNLALQSRLLDLLNKTKPTSGKNHDENISHRANRFATTTPNKRPLRSKHLRNHFVSHSNQLGNRNNPGISSIIASNVIRHPSEQLRHFWLGSRPLQAASQNYNNQLTVHSIGHKQKSQQMVPQASIGGITQLSESSSSILEQPNEDSHPYSIKVSPFASNTLNQDQLSGPINSIASLNPNLGPDNVGADASSDSSSELAAELDEFYKRQRMINPIQNPSTIHASYDYSDSADWSLGSDQLLDDWPGYLQQQQQQAEQQQSELIPSHHASSYIDSVQAQIRKHQSQPSINGDHRPARKKYRHSRGRKVALAQESTSSSPSTSDSDLELDQEKRSISNPFNRDRDRERDRILEKSFYGPGATRFGAYAIREPTAAAGANSFQLAQYGRDFGGEMAAGKQHHQIVHIHTKEKKSHGKYLWPIVGAGLTMLMGFLVISNILLSIPLLAIGASSLFNGGRSGAGWHSQQLVPIYNISSSGRRRRKRELSPLAMIINNQKHQEQSKWHLNNSNRTNEQQGNKNPLEWQTGLESLQETSSALPVTNSRLLLRHFQGSRFFSKNKQQWRHELDKRLERIIESLYEQTKSSPRLFSASNWLGFGSARRQLLRAAYCYGSAPARTLSLATSLPAPTTITASTGLLGRPPIVG